MFFLSALVAVLVELNLLHKLPITSPWANGVIQLLTIGILGEFARRVFAAFNGGGHLSTTLKKVSCIGILILLQFVVATSVWMGISAL